MQRQKTRVILASEYPSVRYFLKEAIEGANSAVIIGQAENSLKTLTLARNLRPDIAIIDCHLPHTVGLEGVPLSRIGGLDTAQTISEDLPNTRVVLLNNLDTETLSEPDITLENRAYFSQKIKGVNIPFTLQTLYDETLPLGTVIFAAVKVQPQVSRRQKLSSLCDKAVLFGGLGILGGLFLMLTIILAGAGVFLAAAGAATLFLGLAGKLANALWPKARQSAKIR